MTEPEAINLQPPSLPKLGVNATPEQVADFLQAYASLDTDTLAKAIAAKVPTLAFQDSQKYAIVSGWLFPQMEYAAIALRQYALDRHLFEINRGVA